MESLLAHCNAVIPDGYGIYLAFFIGGLTGGFTHCLAMCGSFVACDKMCGSKQCASSKTNRISLNEYGLQYHLGRMITYSFLGFLAALLSSQITYFSWWPILSSTMLAVAGIMFLVSCMSSCRHDSKSEVDVQKSANSLTLVRGAFLGFMPCGLLYAALMMAATLANPVSGMLAMFLFTLGTIPALLLASAGADFLSRKKQSLFSNIGRAMMAFNGFSLLIMAAKIMR